MLESRMWQQLFDQVSIEGINNIIIPMRPTTDKLIWVKSSKGVFSGKSAYLANQVTPLISNLSGLWPKVWKIKIHERLKMFLWRLGSNALPTRKMMAQRTGNQDNLCHLCGEAEESDVHLLLFSNAMWPRRMIWVLVEHQN